jgi:TRAP-type C4-dicarboxylate transport system permease small subunit
MRPLIHLFDRLQTLGAWIASLLTVALTLLILTEIVLRSFWDRSTMIADEYSGYLYLALIFFALGYTFREGGHIRIALLTSQLNAKFQRRIDIFAGLTLLGVLLFIGYRSVRMVVDAYQFEMVSETVSETPIWLTQLSMPIGLSFFILAAVAFVYKKAFDDQ